MHHQIIGDVFCPLQPVQNISMKNKPNKTEPFPEVRHKCPYCHTFLRLDGVLHVDHRDKPFTCITCTTKLVYETVESNDDVFFFELPDDDDQNEFRGDHDCEEGEIADLQPQDGEPRPLSTGDAVFVTTKGARGGNRTRDGWLLCDPQVIQEATNRREALYRYVVVFHVDTKMTVEYFPPHAPTGRGVPIRSRERGNMAQIQRRVAEDLEAAQRRVGKFHFKDYHLKSETNRYNVLVNSVTGHIITKGFHTAITATDMCRLAPGKNLNNEIINYYMKLLVKTFSRKFYPIYAFEPFFSIKLMMPPDPEDGTNLPLPGDQTKSKKFQRLVKTCNFTGVLRWTNKVDLFRYKLLLVPVFTQKFHLQLLAVKIQRTQKKPKKNDKFVRYRYKIELKNCCSLGLPSRMMSKMKTYLNLEHLRQHGEFLDNNVFSTVDVKVPEEEDAADCGVHMCAHAYNLCLGFPVKDTDTFIKNQELCNEFRKHIALSIADNKITNRFSYRSDTLKMDAVISSV